METTYSFKEFNKILSKPKQNKLTKVTKVGTALIPVTMISSNVYAFSIGEEIVTMMELLKDTIISAMEEGVKTAIISTGKWVFNGILEISYPVCLSITIISVILYISGFKKTGKYASASFIIYVLLQAIKSVM